MNTVTPSPENTSVQHDSVQTFRLARHWRIITYTLGPAMIGVFIYLLSIPFVLSKSSFLFYFLVPVSIGMIVLLLYGILDARKGGVTLSEHSILVKGPFGDRGFHVSEIRGYKVDDNYIHVYPLDASKKKIKVSRYLENSEWVRQWFMLRFRDLNEYDAEQETLSILQNERFGITVEGRARRMQEARKVAKAVNAISWVACGWIIFYPKPYNVAITVGLLLPLLIITIAYLYRGLMKADENENSSYPSMATGFGVVAAAMAIRALMDFTILEYNKGWDLIALITLMVSLLYLLSTDGLHFRRVSDYLFALILPMVVFMFAYGVSVLGNCMLDNSPERIFETIVLKKSTTKGKSTTYYLTVTPWDGQIEPRQLDVGLAEYELVSEGDIVNIVQRDGYFDMRWVIVKIP